MRSGWWLVLAVILVVSRAEGTPPDTEAPSVRITAPTNHATVSGEMAPVLAEATDNTGVSEIEFALDGRLFAYTYSAPYRIVWDTTLVPDGLHTLTALARDAAGNRSTSSAVTVLASNGTTQTTVWVEDAVPAGAWTAAERGDHWNWVSNNPAPFSGTHAHQSTLAPGIHNHYFSDASARLPVGFRDTLFTYVYLNPANPPREVMLLWFDGTSWRHAAYWGENLIPWGENGTASQRPMGPLPPAGQWVRLEVPAHLVDLEGLSVSGINFVLYDGQATWDYSGSASARPRPWVTMWASRTASERVPAVPGSPDAARFGFQRSTGTNEPLTVYFAVSGTANTNDYEPIGNSVTIPIGAYQTEVEIRAVDDAEPEVDEVIVLTLLPNETYRTFYPTNGSITILDDDRPPTVNVYTTGHADETDYSPPALPVWGAFGFTRSGDTSEPLTVFFTISGTASNGVDYEQVTNSITFPAGADWWTGIEIRPFDDTLAEGLETVVLTLSSSADYTLGKARSATVWIRDDDGGPPTLLIQRATNGVVYVAVLGERGRSYGLYASPNLVNWEQVSTNRVLSEFPLGFVDSDAPGHVRRFYRAVLNQ
jgi:hypothetical protein